MNSQTTLPITEARKQIFDIARQAQYPGVYYTLTKRGRPKAVVLSVQEFEYFKEALNIASYTPCIKE